MNGINGEIYSLTLTLNNCPRIEPIIGKQELPSLEYSEKDYAISATSQTILLPLLLPFSSPLYLVIYSASRTLW